MKKKERHTPRNKGHGLQRYNIRNFVERAKTLQGDPHYIAMGMAIGVGSKPAAAVGVWFCNPITIPFFYLGSYQAGMLILNKSISFDVSIQEFMNLGWDVTIAMIIGGLILGIIPGTAAYFITRKIFTKIRMRKKLEA